MGPHLVSLVVPDMAMSLPSYKLVLRLWRHQLRLPQPASNLCIVGFVQMYACMWSTGRSSGCCPTHLLAGFVDFLGCLLASCVLTNHSPGGRPEPRPASTPPGEFLSFQAGPLSFGVSSVPFLLGLCELHFPPWSLRGAPPFLRFHRSLFPPLCKPQRTRHSSVGTSVRSRIARTAVCTCTIGVIALCTRRIAYLLCLVRSRSSVALS